MGFPPRRRWKESGNFNFGSSVINYSINYFHEEVRLGKRMNFIYFPYFSSFFLCINWKFEGILLRRTLFLQLFLWESVEKIEKYLFPVPLLFFRSKVRNCTFNFETLVWSLSIEIIYKFCSIISSDLKICNDFFYN